MSLQPALWMLVLTHALSNGAPTIQRVAQEGDSIPGVGQVRFIRSLAVNDSGVTLVEVGLQASVSMDQGLLRDGNLVFQEGQPLPAVAGATLGQFTSLHIDAAGKVDWRINTFLPVVHSEVWLYRALTPVLRIGSATTLSGFPAGYSYQHFVDFGSDDQSQMLLLAGFGANHSPEIYALVRLDLDANGSVLSESLVARQGEPAPNSGGLTFRRLLGSQAINRSGDVMFTAELLYGSGTCVYFNSQRIAFEGGPSPVAGRSWGGFDFADVDLNDSGEYVFDGSLDGWPHTNHLIVKNGAKFRQEGDPVPSLGAFTITRFPKPAAISEAGEVLWAADWNDPNPATDSGLFVDDQLLVRDGVTTVGGQVITRIGGATQSFGFSPSGRYILFEAEVGLLEGAYLIDRGELGDDYCVAAPNSTGVGATISAMGSASLLDQNVTLSARGLPAGVVGLFHFGPNRTQSTFGDGFRCVAGSVNAVYPPLPADASGAIKRQLDFSAAYATALTAGTTNFQLWYRDPSSPGGAGFNASDAVEVAFQ